jgi:hypothetical protein
MTFIADPNPWKIFVEGKLRAQVRDHATAKQVVQAIHRQNKKLAIVTRYQGRILVQPELTKGGNHV